MYSTPIKRKTPTYTHIQKMNAKTIMIKRLILPRTIVFSFLFKWEIFFYRSIPPKKLFGKYFIIIIAQRTFIKTTIHGKIR
ncbi:hypothetical protein D0U04_02055 [Bacillus clarus]|uniref:Uncharacterized protein n=1 Tax=Bacillus clarus TaxID=2338372 RepID=A0A090YTL5_9BACI|nr:hypothetical protein DJ93_3857 [Bacillus clarus]RFT68256.1 hypothetical protein D0U04_02055 [Bacillus clarus]